MHSIFLYLFFFFKAAIDYACENINPDILNMDLSVFSVSYMSLDKIKANVNNTLLIFIIKQL